MYSIDSPTADTSCIVFTPPPPLRTHRVYYWLAHCDTSCIILTPPLPTHRANYWIPHCGHLLNEMLITWQIRFVSKQAYFEPYLVINYIVYNYICIHLYYNDINKKLRCIFKKDTYNSHHMTQLCFGVLQTKAFSIIYEV